MIRWAIASSAALVLACAASPSRADPTPEDRALSQTLFDEAKRLMDEKRFAEACPKFEESQRLDPGGGTALNLAACWEGQGRTAAAWTEFNEALSRARADGRADRAAFAQEHLRAIEPRLARVSVVVGPGADVPGLVVTRDGKPLARAAWSVATPIDPGQHRFVATAPGRRAWESAVTITEGARITVSVPPLVDESAPAPVVPVAPPPAEESGGGSTQRTLGFVVGGAGIVGLGIGTVFGVVALSKRSKADAICPASVCTPAQADAVTFNNSAKSAALASDVALGVGLAAVAGGVVLVVTAKRSASIAVDPRGRLNLTTSF